MSLFKYFQERGGADSGHGGELAWPRLAGMPPFRNVQAPALTQDQVESAEEQLDFHSAAFELWDVEQHQAYDEIRDRAANGWYQILHIDRQYVPEHKNWRILLEWAQVYQEIPHGKRPGPPARDTIPLFQGGEPSH